ncbi:MAG: hypothetical protein ABIG61_08135 [Planctomycetota bacterium]
MKITLIGGGSVGWTPILASSLLTHSKFFDGAELCLMDINQTALDNVIKVCSQLNSQADIKLKFTTTTDMADALRGADYVAIALAIGGMDATEQDHLIGRKYGFTNLKGHDIGAAGFSRTLRHVAFMVNAARLMEKYCPKAMVLNLTNPLIANTWSINNYSSIKAYGFCHGVIGYLEAILPLMGAKSIEEASFVTAGVDHCSWLLKLIVNGRDGLEILRENNIIEKAYKRENVAQIDDPFAGIEEQKLRFIVWDMLGYLPGIGDMHICEFFGQFLKDKETVKYWQLEYDRAKLEREGRIQAAKEQEETLKGKKPVRLIKSNEIIARVIAALSGHDNFISVLNAPNTGQISNLPYGSIVETNCTVNSAGIQPITVGPLPDILDSIVRPVLLHEKLYMEAAYEWNKSKAIAALSTDPIVNDFRKTKQMVEEYFQMNQQVLESIGIKIGSWQ